MSHTPRVGLWLLRLALLAVLVVCTIVQPQQGAQDKKAAPAQQVWPDEQLEQWVFQQDRNASGARKRLDSLLALQIESLDRACKLTEPQKKKLQLTGRGDIKRFFDGYETVKQKFQLINGDEQKLQEIWRDISPLQMTLQAGLFHDDSLLYKSLHHTLTDEQFARYDAIAHERRAFRHQANIELAVTVLEQQGTPLRDTQRRELITFLTKHTKPLRKSGQYDYYFVMFQLGRVPEGKLKPLFDDLQWKVVSRQLAQFQQNEQWLKQSGQWPDEDDEVGRILAQPLQAKE